MQNKKNITFAEAIDKTFYKIFKNNKNAIIIGLGVNDPKAIFGTTKTINEKFPKRVLDMPLSENSMTGVVTGASLNGLRPILVHQRLDFALLSMEQIINQAAKWFYMFDGKKNVPIIIRMIVGRGWGQGPQHSQSLQSIFSHIPGLKVVMPSTVESAQNLLSASFYENNPVIFIEHRWLHNIQGKEIFINNKEKIGKSKILKKGKDITIISSSYMTIESLRILKYLNEYKIDAELIDLQTISPLDNKTIEQSVNKTGKCLVLDTGHKSFGVSAEIISNIIENCYVNLKTKPMRIANPDYPVPTSFSLSKHYYPSKYEIFESILKILKIKKKPPGVLISKDKFQDQPFEGFTGPF